MPRPVAFHGMRRWNGASAQWLDTVAEKLPDFARQARPLTRLGLGKLTGRKSPYQVTFSLTNRCNFLCAYCHIPQQHRDEMSTSEWFACFREFRAAGMGRASH